MPSNLSIFLHDLKKWLSVLCWIYQHSEVVALSRVWLLVQVIRAEKQCDKGFIESNRTYLLRTGEKVLVS